MDRFYVGCQTMPDALVFNHVLSCVGGTWTMEGGNWIMHMEDPQEGH